MTPTRPPAIHGARCPRPRRGDRHRDDSGPIRLAQADPTMARPGVPRHRRLLLRVSLSVTPLSGDADVHPHRPASTPLGPLRRTTDATAGDDRMPRRLRLHGTRRSRPLRGASGLDLLRTPIPDPPGPGVIPRGVLLALSIVIGLAVLASWVTQMSGRRWRPEPSWIDRAGRVMGAAWIVAGSISALAQSPPSRPLKESSPGAAQPPGSWHV